MKINKTPDDICSEVEKENLDSYIPMSPPIVQTSSFYYKSYENFIMDSNDEKNNFVYTRGSNPTTSILEKKLAELEGGETCKVFSSGMGAISATLFSLLNQNDHILMVNTIYGEAVKFAKDLSRFGISIDRIDVNSADEIGRYIKPNTKLIYFESPSSQKFELLDLELISNIAKEHNIFTIIDSTWSSPIFQKPLHAGIDIVIHSLSKYISGHSDVVGGAIIGNKKTVDLIFDKGHQALGAVTSPFNSWLTIRGLRTLPLRVNNADKSIRYLLDHLNKDSRIQKIYHPYCGNDYQKMLANKYLTGYGSLFAIDLVDNDFDKLKIFVNSLNTISLGVSWGGFESLVLPSYKGNNSENLKERGLPLSHIRIYIGLEDISTIINDIDQALDRAYGE